MNLAVDPSVDPILDQIRSRVAPTVLAHEQTLPVAEGLAELFAERALVRGRTLACLGPAGTSAAMTLVAEAVAAGSWLAVVDVPTFGLDAASEMGIPLERVVAISTTDPVTADWVEVMAAAVDGFDLVLSRRPSPSLISETALRKLSTRIRQRGAVVVLLDDSTGADTSCDGVVTTSGVSWSGLGSGYGHLQQRTLDLSSSGRRLPGRRQCRLGLVRAGLQAGVHDGVHDDVA